MQRENWSRYGHDAFFVFFLALFVVDLSFFADWAVPVSLVGSSTAISSPCVDWAAAFFFFEGFVDFVSG